MSARGSTGSLARPTGVPDDHRWRVAGTSRAVRLVHLAASDARPHRVAPGPGTTVRLLDTLRAGRVVGLLADRDLVGNGVEVELFGERTTLPAGPALLALRSGAPLMTCAIYQRPRGLYHAVLQPPLDSTRTGRMRQDVQRLTEEMARSLEGLIRLAPEQWHLFQPNWPSDRERYS